MVAFLTNTSRCASQQQGPIQLLTWLSGVKNSVFLGAKPGHEHNLGHSKDTETADLQLLH